MTAQTPLQSKELYDAQAPVRGQFVPGDSTVADLVPLDLTAITVLTNTATGTEIATAVNALIAALQAAKITL